MKKNNFCYQQTLVIVLVLIMAMCSSCAVKLTECSSFVVTDVSGLLMDKSGNIAVGDTITLRSSAEVPIGSEVLVARTGVIKYEGYGRYVYTYAQTGWNVLAVDHLRDTYDTPGVYKKAERFEEVDIVEVVLATETCSVD